MGADFGEVTVTLKKDQRVMDAVKTALDAEGKKDVYENSQYGFTIDDVTIMEIKGDEVTCKVEYEY